MDRPAQAGALPGLGAVGTPRSGRGADTMETTMTKNICRPKASASDATGNANAVATRGRRQRPQTKKQICIALLERPKGASIAEMQNAMGWQAHSVRGFLASTVKKLPGFMLVSDKPDNRQRRYRIVPAGS